MNSTIKELFENEFGLDVDTMPIGKPINVYESKVLLKGFDTKTNKVGFSRVRYAIKKPISDMLRITTEFDTLPDVSTKHLFATYDNGNLDWTLANDLQIGDYLYDANNNPIKITNIASVKEDYVYDVETDFGNYFSHGILSHNSPMARLPTATGGEAINYYTSITCRITKTDDIKDATGDVCGIEMRVRNYKNKCSVPFRDANMKLYYDGGFDSNSEYIDFLLLLGMVKQAGAYFKFTHEGQDYSLQGRKKLQEWLDTHADVYDSWKKEIIEKISHHNEILDANNQATDENGNEISLDEAKKMGNAVDPAELASQALAAATADDAVTD